MPQTETELRSLIVDAVMEVEAHLDRVAVIAVVDGLTPPLADLTRLARTLHRDPAVLTTDAGASCTAKIEPLIDALRVLGARSVVMPKCAICLTATSETYSRQLRNRVCQQCAMQRWRPEEATCASCGRVRPPVYKSRRGEALCRACPPEPDVDHAAGVREGIGQLNTGLPEATITAIVATFRAKVTLRQLNWILHDTPKVFTGAEPHVSAPSVQLAERLIAAGAAGIRTPVCPRCSREVPLGSTLDGLRCCNRCWRHQNARGSCERCGKERHLTNYHGAGQRICGTCYTHAAEHDRPCTNCGRVAFIAHRSGDTMLCRRCYRGPTAVCAYCKRERQCDRIKTGTPICQTCAAKRRAKEPCSVCAKVRLVHLRTEQGQPVCDRCGRKREACARCGHIRVVVGRLAGVGPLCGSCLETEPAYFVDCVQCGAHSRAYHRGLCNNCACPGVLTRLFSRDDSIGDPAAQIIAALLRHDRTAVLHWAEETKERRRLADAISGMDALSHATLDALPASNSVDWLRNVLVNAQALPPRDHHLHRTELFIKKRLEGIQHAEDRSTVRTFMEWHHLRKLRQKAGRRPLRFGHGAGARTEMTAIAVFLASLHESGSDLNSCVQADVDSWLVANPTKVQINQFLKWATKRGYAHNITAPTPPDRRTRRTLPAGDDERWQLIQRLIEDGEIEVRDRVAGLLVLLYSQQTSRLVTLTTSSVTVDENNSCTITLGDVPLSVPEPLAVWLLELVAHRRGYAAVDLGTNPWLFPGGRAGQHISAQRMGIRLKRIGVSPKLARNTALIALAGELPAVVLAKLLGFSVKRAVVWNAEAGNTNPGYAAAVARRNRVQLGDRS